MNLKIDVPKWEKFSNTFTAHNVQKELKEMPRPSIMKNNTASDLVTFPHLFYILLFATIKEQIKTIALSLLLWKNKIYESIDNEQ